MAEQQTVNLAAEGSSPSSGASPLLEAAPDSLDELMSRDPEGWTLEDKEKIVTALRNQRSKFNVAEAEGKRLTPARRPKAKAPTLEDLGL